MGQADEASGEPVAGDDVGVEKAAPGAKDGKSDRVTAGEIKSDEVKVDAVEADEVKREHDEVKSEDVKAGEPDGEGAAGSDVEAADVQSGNVKSAQFSVDEKVLVFHGSLLYEATVIDVVKGDNGDCTFKIHYLGWRDSWDEVVEATRIKKYTEESVQLREYLLSHLSSNRKRERAEPQAAAESVAVPSGNKGRRRKQEPVPERGEADNDVKQNASPTAELPAAITLHSTLKRQLIDDWEFVTKDHRLITLPREPNVQSILSSWLQSRSRKGLPDNGYKAFADGLREYFDSALGTILLYKFERAQYNGRVHGASDSVKPSKMYGAEHLLRLLVKLPTMLDKSLAAEEKKASVAEKVNDIAKFLYRNGRIVFLPEYEAADDAYVAKAFEH